MSIIPQRISNKTLKIVLFFLAIFAFQMLLALFLLARPLIGYAIGETRAGGDKGNDTTTCACAEDKTNPNGIKESTRLFIPVPGVTDACGWVCDINGDQKGDVVDYVVTGYKFLIGLAAIVAVIMIMYGGYSWIFAMGNSSQIEGAKETITSAVIGLGLALVSVQFLTVINPQLTNVTLPDLQKIERRQLGQLFCGGEDIVLGGKKKKDNQVKLMNQINTLLLDTTGKIRMNFSFEKDDLEWGDSIATNSLQCDSDNEVKVAHVSVSSSEVDSKKEVSGIDCFLNLCNPEINFNINLNPKLPDYQDQKVKLANGNIAVIKQFINERYSVPKDMEPFISASLSLGDIGAGCFGGGCNLNPEEEAVKFPMCAVQDNVQKPFPIECVSTEKVCEKLDREKCFAFGQELQGSTNNPYNQYGCVPAKYDQDIINKFFGSAETGAKTGLGVGVLAFTILFMIPGAGWLAIGAIGAGIALGAAFGAFTGAVDSACTFGPALHCPVGWAQIDPLRVPKKNICWTEDKDKQRVPFFEEGTVFKKKTFVVNDGERGVHDSPFAICCINPSAQDTSKPEKQYSAKKELAPQDIIINLHPKVLGMCTSESDCPQAVVNKVDGVDNAKITFKCLPDPLIAQKICQPVNAKVCYVYGNDSDARFYFKTPTACQSQKPLYADIQPVPYNCVKALVPPTVDCSDKELWGWEKYATKMAEGGGQAYVALEEVKAIWKTDNRQQEYAKIPEAGDPPGAKIAGIVSVQDRNNWISCTDQTGVPLPDPKTCSVYNLFSQEVTGICTPLTGKTSDTKTITKGICQPTATDTQYQFDVCYLLEGGILEQHYYQTYEGCKASATITKCTPYVVSANFKRTKCLGTQTSTGGESGTNPLVALSDDVDKDTQVAVQSGFAQGALILKPRFGEDKNTAESFLEALAMVESEGKKGAYNGNHCGLMQLTAGTPEVGSHDCEWLKNNPAASIVFAARIIEGMFKNTENVCPTKASGFGIDPSPRTCDYTDGETADTDDNPQDDGKSKFYSPCRSFMQNGSIEQKMRYLYAAYNGGSSANCHNQTNFFEDGMCKPPEGFCTDYKTKKGSIWECDKKTDSDGPWQTRNGAKRLVDCVAQFNAFGSAGSQLPKNLTGCCNQGSCVPNSCSP